MTGFSENNDAEPRWLNPILRGDKQQIQVNFKGKDLSCAYPGRANPAKYTEKHQHLLLFLKFGRVVFRKSILETVEGVQKYGLYKL